MYVYASGDGLDRIIDDSGSDDTIYFSSELDSADLLVVRIAGTNDLQVHFGNLSEGIVLTNQWSSAAGAVEHFQFVAEQGLHAGDIASLYLATLATAGANNITGSWAGERIVGLDGNDTLSGLAGNDEVDGGAGTDTLSGGDGDDVLLGGDGNDALNGNKNEDRLVGGAGNDTLIGWSGDDTYVFNRGDGQDMIQEFWDVGSGGFDTVLLGAGILLSDLIVTQVGSGNDLLLSIAGGSDSVLLDNTLTNSDYRIEQVLLADGTILSHADLVLLATLPTAGNDIFYGSYDPDTLQGGAGNDTLSAHKGNDTLIGGTGNDTLIGWEGDDTYVFNRGDGQDIVQEFWDTGPGGSDTILFGVNILPVDIIVTQVGSGNDLRLSIGGTADSILLDNTVNDSDYRIEQVQFADGTVWTHAYLLSLATFPTSGNDVFYGSYDVETLQGGAGNDTLDARDGNDTLIGGTGNDILTGWGGNDTYVFNLGDGQDIVRDFWSTGLGGADTILFGAGILPGDLIVTQVGGGYDLLLSIAGTADSVLLDNTVNDSDYRIEQVQFADGTIWTHAALLTLATTPTAGNDAFYGSYDAETLAGGAGNDTLNAHDGNDTLIGGAGNDILTGWGGDDSYVFNLGDGEDTIREFWSSGPGGVDTLLLGTGILPSAIVVTQLASGTDLRLSISGTTDSILLDNTINDSDYRIEQVQFADGTIWTHANLMALATAPTSGNDIFYGGYDADTLQGGAGDDALDGREGNDTLTGGTGDDIVTGGGGVDIYHYALGDGSDILYDSSYDSAPDETLILGPGFTAANLIFTRSTTDTDDLIITFNNAAGSIIFDEQYKNSGIEIIQFSDGTFLTEAQFMI